MTGALLVAALVGVLHVHHEPSHDSEAPFSEVLAAAGAQGLDFVVLTEHADPEAVAGALPAAERAGLYERPDGGSLLVLVGVEYGTREGHLLALDVPGLVPAEQRPARDVIRDVHAQGGFAVVPHPFSYGGWQDWEAPFDGIEVHNNASAFRGLGAWLPLVLVRHAFDRRGALRQMLGRPERELEQWDELLLAGRPVRGFSGADVHRNVSLLGWRLDSYDDLFAAVHTVCPPGPLEADALWTALREGRCAIRYALFEERAAEAEQVAFPSGRVELQLDGGRRVLEIRNPIIADE